MQEKEIKDAINAYSKLSDEELMIEFMKHMTVQKTKDGGASMRETINRIKPLLNETQCKRLDEIIKSAERGI